MPAPEASDLWVEGKDDQHAIKHLLQRHGVDFDHISVQVRTPAGNGADTAGGHHEVLQAIQPAIMASTGRSVGFVLDADEVTQDRWYAVRNRIEDVGGTLPDAIPSAGFVGVAQTYQTRFGIWLMPDNRRPGALEDFLQDLVEAKDKLLPLAQDSTRQAKEHGARFPESSHRKAVLHAWLAWQQRPGLPYGSAIAARYFSHDSAAALAFVDWFRRVFEEPG